MRYSKLDISHVDKNYVFHIISIIHIIISIYMDNIIFLPDRLLTNTIYLCIKPFSILAIVSFWRFVCKLLSDKDDSYTRTFMKHFIIYFSIMLVFLLLTWPGVWRNDEPLLLQKDIGLVFNGWHHWLTDAYYIWALGIIGFPTGIIIVQNILRSIMFAYTISNVESLLSESKKDMQPLYIYHIYFRL